MLIGSIATARSHSGTAFVCLLSVLGLGSTGQGEQSRRVGDQLRSYLATLHDNTGFSGSVLVTQGDRTLAAASYGFANREHQVPNGLDTKFRIASMTKQFTAMGILILQERGALQVTDTVGAHLKDIPATWRALTVHQLLTHTSGLVHPPIQPGFWEDVMVPATHHDTMRRYRDEPLLFEPGTRHEYSGLGYVVLARIIEESSGQPYEAFLRSEIFTPLGMTQTGADQPQTVLEGRAQGYVVEDDAVVNASMMHMPILTGAGNLYSTVTDLGRWNQALAARRLISEESYDALYTPELNDYAYGWAVKEGGGHTLLRHNGGAPGFNSVIARLPDAEVCVVILSNVSPTPVDEITEDLLDIVVHP